MISHVISTSAMLCLLATPVSAQQVVFSRRVYAAAGRTFQQLGSVPVEPVAVSTGAPVPRY
jgi:hypothetical protein